MAQPYVGEIRMFGGNFAPAGWMFCEGQLLAISEYDTLFQLIGTTYGGDGQTTFALPDLRGRLPLHQGNGFTLAQTGGVEEVMLSTTQMPNHEHTLVASSDIGTLLTPNQNVLAQMAAKPYRAGSVTTSLAASSLTYIGGSQPHDNRQPYLCVSFIISLFGIFPSQN